jgi:hypothetical protein
MTSAPSPRLWEPEFIRLWQARGNAGRDRGGRRPFSTLDPA